MPSDDLRAFGGEMGVSGDDARSLSLDADLRGFTGLLVGLLIGMAAWGLVFLVWWLV